MVPRHLPELSTNLYSHGLKRKKTLPLHIRRADSFFPPIPHLEPGKHYVRLKVFEKF